MNATVLALGIAGVTTIAGLVSGLVRPLPYAGPERLVFVLAGDATSAGGSLSPAEVDAVEQQAPSLERVATLTDDVALFGTGADARSHRGIRVSPHLSEMLGDRPRLGRALLAGDGTDAVVLLGERFWRNELGGRSDVVGQTIVLDGHPVKVLGVAGERARLKPMLGFEPAWWRPLQQDGVERPSRLFALGRLRAGATVASLEAELDLLGRRLAASGGTADRKLWPLSVAGLIDPLARVLVVLVLGAILGIVCLNVGGVLLASALVRGREMAIRQALGARPRDVSALVLAEGVLLGVLGGLLALPLTVGAARVLSGLAAGTNADALSVEADGWLFGVSLILSLLAGALAGLAPALQWRRDEPARLLNEGTYTATVSRRAGRIRFALVAGQVAVSLTLLTQAALALSSLRALLAADRGFSARGVLALPLQARPGRPLGRELLERVGGVPGVRAAVLSSSLPAESPLEAYGLPGGTAGQARVTAVSAGYFEALGIALHAGRVFAGADDAMGSPVAVVSDVLAQAEGGSRVLGRQIELAGARRTVIGVVAATRNPPLRVRPQPEVYLPWPQSPSSSGWLLVRTPFDAAAGLAGPVVAAVEADGSGRHTAGVRPLDEALAVNMGAIRLGTALLAAIAAGALVLTTAGIFGVVSFLMARRAREIGIRMALGARTGGVLRLVLSQGLRPVAVGLAIGSAVSLALGRLLASRVHGLRPVEPALLVVGGLVLLAALALACALPARRALRVDPVAALRSE